MPNHFYNIGAIVTPYPRNNVVYKATAPGTTGGSQPDFPAEVVDGDDTVTDGDVTWGFYKQEISYDLNAAAAMGWRIKMGKCSEQFTFKNDVESYNRDEVFKHCQEMEKSYSRLGTTTVAVASPYTSLTGFYPYRRIVP